MDWTIYITNIPALKANFTEILGIYGLRWRIEVIFKAWKSHLKFDILHRVSARQMRILLKTRLLVIAAASNLYGKFERALWLKHRRRLSPLNGVSPRVFTSCLHGYGPWVRGMFTFPLIR